MFLFHSFINTNCIFIILITIIPYIFSNLIFEYPTAITLDSGNILVAEKYGIFLCDPSFSIIINNITFFDTEDQISTEEDLSKVILKREQNYIFCLINYKIYILNKLGNLIYNSGNKLITTNPNYCTLCPIGIEDKMYSYVIGYFDNDNNLNLLLYKYDIENKKNVYIYSNVNDIFKVRFYNNYYKSYYFRNRGLACEYLLENNPSDENYLVCFFVIYYDGMSFLSKDII